MLLTIMRIVALAWTITLKYCERKIITGEIILLHMILRFENWVVGNRD